MRRWLRSQLAQLLRRLVWAVEMDPCPKCSARMAPWGADHVVCHGCRVMLPRKR